MMALMMTLFSINRDNKYKKIKSRYYDLETSLSELGIVENDMEMIRVLINDYIKSGDKHCYMIAKNMMQEIETKHNLQ
jgi:hypothetical protein